MHPSLAVTLTLIALAVPRAFATEPDSSSVGMWSGKVKDEKLQALAPKSGFIADAQTWQKLWTSWRPGEEVPKIDFERHLVLVGTVSGPNSVLMQPKLTDGNVTFVVGGTLMAGPGFGYKLVQFSRRGVKTVQGESVSSQSATADDSISVTVVGTLQTGVVAIGGESTGTTITANNITWELAWDENHAVRQLAEELAGHKVVVRGTLKRIAGVELSERWIVTVTSLRSAHDAVPATAPAPEFSMTAGRTDTQIRTFVEHDSTVFDIHSKFGIDTVTIQRISHEWPESVILRLHLKGLESLEVTSGETTVSWSVTSTGSHPVRVSMREGKNESRLDDTSPYYAELQIVANHVTIPLKNGHFQVALPAKLFEGNPEMIKLRWIDFYRN